MREFPHQMSGGMRQRIVGAIALAGGPKLIIADEPTTNLDVTIQAQYLDLLKELQEKTGVAIIFVTHNLGIVARMCDKLAVMYAGKIVEAGSVRDLFNAAEAPLHQGAARLDAEAWQQGEAAAPSRASRPIWPPCRRAAPFIRAAPRRCRCAPAKRRPRCRFAAHWTARCWRAESLTTEPAKDLHVAAAAGS